MYADLHMHTNYSDGVFEIEEVIKKAKYAGLKCIAITDHDTFSHYSKVKDLGEKYDVLTIPGVEISCYNYRMFKKVHIVGLFLNETAPHVEALCNKILKKRDAYHKQLIKQFCDMGYEITYDECKAFSPYSIVFKMNIFQAIKQKYPDVDDLFYKKYFQGKVERNVELNMGYATVEEGIKAILKDGGIPILAHPNFYDSFSEIDEYVSYGLEGIEVDHHSMNDKDRFYAKKLAKKYHLYQSGGSDFHKDRYTDDGKEHLGTFGLSEEEFTAFMYEVRKIRHYE